MRKQHAITSGGFITALFVLLLNDFYFKPYFHNAITGKLSDFAGLFIFPFFFSSFALRFKTSIYVFTGLSFIFWKSSHSQSLIDWWNQHGLLTIGRTIDYTDLSALLILPISYFYSGKNLFSSNRAVVYTLIIVSVFAFTATSQRRAEYEYFKEYEFIGTKSDLVKMMNDLVKQSRLSFNERSQGHYQNIPGVYDIFITSDDTKGCTGMLDATIHINEMPNQCVLVLRRISNRCPESEKAKNEALQIFEKEFIEKINAVGK